MSTFSLQKEVFNLIEKDCVEWTVNTAGFEVTRIINTNSAQTFYFHDSLKTYTRIDLSNDFVVYGRLSGIIYSQKKQSYFLAHFDQPGYFSFFSSELRHFKQKNACSATPLDKGYFDININIKIPYLSRQLAGVLSDGEIIDCEFPLLMHFIVLYKGDLVEDFFTQPFYSTIHSTIYHKNKREKKMEELKKMDESKKQSKEEEEEVKKPVNESKVNEFFLSDEIEIFPRTKKQKNKKEEGN